MSATKYHIALAADHAGFELKQKLIQALETDGHQVTDLGTNSEDSVDYPDFGQKLGQVMTGKKADFGIAVCGSGIGISIALNRFPAVRCALCHNSQYAEMARLHNDANVLALGSRMIDGDEALNIVRTFLNTKFDGGERHGRRIKKLGECCT